MDQHRSTQLLRLILGIMGLVLALKSCLAGTPISSVETNGDTNPSYPSNDSGWYSDSDDQDSGWDFGSDDDSDSGGWDFGSDDDSGWDSGGDWDFGGGGDSGSWDSDGGDSGSW
jgi:hypothetical protein